MTARDTGMMEQWRATKLAHPGCILLYRVGDFYEMFYDDAEVASRVLGLTLTSRNNGGATEVPLAGVPARAMTEYVRRLVRLGHRVAICEQVEDPKLAKGIVRREVVETVTPGAAFADELLDGAANNFLCAVQVLGATAGVAGADVSTGELRLVVAPAEELGAVLARFAPRELLVVRGADAPPIGASGAGPLVAEREAWEFDAGLARDDLARHYGVLTLDGFGVAPAGAGDDAALGAAGALLRYLRELLPSGVPHLARPTVERAGGAMPLDEMTRRNLELVESLRGGDDPTAGTLLSVLDRTLTPMGARLLRRWLLAPLLDAGAIDERLDAVARLAADPMARETLRDALDGVRDVERLASKAAAGRATPRELRSLGDSVARLPAVREGVERVQGKEARVQGAGCREEERPESAHPAPGSPDPAPGTPHPAPSTLHPAPSKPHPSPPDRLSSILSQWDACADLRDEIVRALVERPPLQLGDEPTIAEGVDAELDDLRRLRDGGKELIAEVQAAERARTGIPSLKVGYNRVFGYFIEVSNAYRARVPDDYQRRQTLTGAERYVTPALKAHEERVLTAAERIEQRERELFEALRARVGAAIGRLQCAARLVAELDVLASLAEVAEREGYVRPEVGTGFDLEIEAGRHPVVERMMPRDKFIPNDLRLTSDARLVVLTGPNMAGKSTVLRQIGLIVLMAQVGSFVPARRARVAIADRVFTRVGASDNLVRGQSTFMVEMSETSAILHSATARSLVLLDEIGRGTSTYDGVSIAWSVSEHLYDAIRCKTVFATHYHELARLADGRPAVRNMNVAVREARGEVLFLHRLAEGPASRSYGIEVGRLAGLPPTVLQRAREVLADLEGIRRGETHARGGRRATPMDPSQLGLFVAAPAAPAEPHPVVEELRSLNADELTPMQALQLVARLAERARADEG